MMGVLKFSVLVLCLTNFNVNCSENSTTTVAPVENHNRNHAVTIVTANDIKADESVLRAARDTYIEAYMKSHGGPLSIPVPKKQIMNRDENYPPADFYPRPQNDYGSPIYTNDQPKIVNSGAPPSGPGYSYNPPSQPSPSYASYGSPHNSYGPPASGPPTNMYGPPSIPATQAWPAPVYGAPTAPMYGPPPPTTIAGIEMPHSMMGFLDKFKLKLNVFTLLKILLKLVIFKKIVKFIAILMLLLFIPQFKPKEMSMDTGNEENEDDSDIQMMMNEDDDDMMRKLSPRSFNVEKRLNMLTAFVHDALATYSAKQFEIDPKEDGASCQGYYCIVQTVLKTIDRTMAFGKLFSSYYTTEMDP